jgi:hypothetical protein
MTVDVNPITLIGLIESIGIGNFVLGWLVFWGTRFVSQNAVPVGAFFVRLATTFDHLAATGIPVSVKLTSDKPLRVVVVDDLRDLVRADHPEPTAAK